MTNVKVTDEWLYQYMPVVDTAIIQELEKQVDIEYFDYKFSKKFNHKMKLLMQEERFPLRKSIYGISKKIAVVFIGILSTFLLITMSVDAYRINFFKTVKTIYEDSILYSFFRQNSEVQFKKMAPIYIPDGYIEIDKIVTDNWLSITYTNSNDELIIWDQMLVTNEGKVMMDSEYDILESKEINGGVVDVAMYSNGYAYAYYEYEDYLFILTANCIDLDTILSMFESIEIIEE